MARYAARAQTYWETYLPSRVATISDPTEFFRDLSNQVEEQIEDALQQPVKLPENATPEQIVAAHRGQLAAATEEALTDLVFLTPEPGTEDRRLPGTTLEGWDAPTEPTPAG